MIIFETPRLAIREFTLADADWFFQLNSDKDVMRFIRAPKNRAECDAFLLQNIRFYNMHPKLGRWAVFEKSTQDFIGSFALIPIEHESSNIQIGYALQPSAWGKGYATELAEYGKKLFFQTHNKDVLYAITEELNVASQRVLLKAGFQQDGLLILGDKNLLRFRIGRNARDL